MKNTVTENKVKCGARDAIPFTVPGYPVAAVDGARYRSFLAESLPGGRGMAISERRSVRRRAVKIALPDGPKRLSVRRRFWQDGARSSSPLLAFVVVGAGVVPGRGQQAPRMRLSSLSRDSSSEHISSERFLNRSPGSLPRVRCFSG